MDHEDAIGGMIGIVLAKPPVENPITQPASG